VWYGFKHGAAHQSAAYLQRTEWNVRDSDGTVIFTIAAKLAGGSKRTVEFAHKHGKPLLHISYAGSYERPGVASVADLVIKWVLFGRRWCRLAPCVFQ
jgi:hypothetical protein